MTAVATKATSETASTGVSRDVLAVFAGLMLGSLIASLNMTLVAPALPTIVAELGGLADYSWIPISAMLASTIVTPIAGKLSDVYGRKPLYMTGIVVFAVGSALSGVAPNFWFLVFARFVQGAGMGFLMPLSQAIIGDIISPRERGKYQGMMGASFGLASIVGPAAGGFITEHFTWRWLFFVNLPIAALTLVVISLYMHVPNERRRRSIDVWGSVTLTGGITCALLATVWGGVQYPWASIQIVGLYSATALLLAAFAWVELRAPDPVLPLKLWASRIFTLSNIASIGVAMSMFGAIFFLPVFVQGVIGNSVTSSGAILVPMLLAMIVTSIAGGQFISHTGRYKVPLLAGLVSMGAGYYMLANFNVDTTNETTIVAMVLIGLGLGMSMQTYTLIVQNSVSREDMAVATSATQLSRSIGAAVGLAILGTLLTQGMQSSMARYLPPAAVQRLQASGNGSSATAVFDPSQLAHLPAAIAAGIRHGLADALHPVFLAGLPIIAVAFIATLFIPELPLRTSAHVTAGRQTAAK
ncbi:MAG TPA: DHA2 family efflux MFS transporter permease subunit [Candidatus Dormibacteraeota bacterium]|nr:DHA2 family efflux MFS transporter permease subunit [Candidatus Dormibacteraeota bacterium]